MAIEGEVMEIQRAATGDHRDDSPPCQEHCLLDSKPKLPVHYAGNDMIHAGLTFRMTKNAGLGHGN